VTSFHATKGGALAVQTTGSTVILAARAGGWYLGLSLGLPTWWLPRGGARAADHGGRVAVGLGRHREGAAARVHDRAVTSSPRPGTHIPGAGTVIGPGPEPGTTWAVTNDPDIAGTIVDADGHPGQTMSRAEQALRQARAALIIRDGAVAAIHDVPDGTTGPLGPWTRRQSLIHTSTCPALPTAVAGVNTLNRADVAAAALRCRRYGTRDTHWCPTCLAGPALTGDDE
jgi:hypothetical protein